MAAIRKFTSGEVAALPGVKDAYLRTESRLHLRGVRGAEEEFLLTATIANLMLLARPAARPARSRRTPEPPCPDRVEARG